MRVSAIHHPSEPTETVSTSTSTCCPPLPVARAALLATLPCVVHGITGRVPGMGAAAGNIGFSAPRDQADAWRMRQRWAAAIGVDPHALTVAGQIHGTTVRHVTATEAGAGAAPGTPHLGLADALITDAPGVVLLSLHADCLPLLLVDPRRPAVGVVHAGWRGTVGDIAGATVRAMTRSFGTNPADLLAFLGPAIHACCYEVGPDVVSPWLDQGNDFPEGGQAIGRIGNATTFDLPLANSLLLQRVGVPPTAIEISPTCTSCSKDQYFSHRAQGPGTGRFGAIIALTNAVPGLLSPAPRA